MKPEKLQAIKDGYDGMRKELADKYKSYFKAYLYNGKKDESRMIEEKMLSLGLIDPEDARICKVNNTCGSTIPQWIYRIVPDFFFVEFDVMEHVDTMLEYSKECEQKMPARKVTVGFYQAKSVRQVKCFIEFGMKITDRPKPLRDLGELCELGIYRIYNIEAESRCNRLYRNIGIVIAGIDETGKMIVYWLVNNENLLRLWLPIESFYYKSKSKFNSEVLGIDSGNIGSGKLQEVMINNIDKYLERQENMIKKSNKDEPLANSE